MKKTILCSLLVAAALIPFAARSKGTLLDLQVSADEQSGVQAMETDSAAEPADRENGGYHFRY